MNGEGTHWGSDEDPRVDRWTMAHMHEDFSRAPDLSVPWVLPADPASVTLARHAVRRHLATAGVTSADVIDTAELLVSELTSNVLKHTGGRPSIRVVVRTHVIRVEVTDRAPALLPIERTLDAEAESGRGLLLVAALAQSWGYGRQADEKLTWFELAVDADEDQPTSGS